MKYAAINLNLDSLGEAYSFPYGYKDPTFFEVSERFFKIAKEYKFKYSIYVLGKDLEKPENRERVKEWAAQGHEIGNHSWSHPQNLGAMNKSKIRREVELAHKIITETVGYEPKGFIAPGWCTSSDLVKVLMELNYTYDTSGFPSWLMLLGLLKMLLNHMNNSRRLVKILHRKDFLYWLCGPRNPYRTESTTSHGITMLPLPTNKYRVACWHTLVFMFGWKIHERILKSCLEEVDAFYYLIHPADLIDEKDLIPGRKISLERLKTPLELKQQYLERSIKIILESGRKIITMEELARKYGNGREALL